MRRCEFKKRYNPNSGKHEYRHIYGEGIMDTINNMVMKIFGKTTKKLMSETAGKAGKKIMNKTGNYVGNKAGDKIVQMLQKGKKSIQPPPEQKPNNNTPMTQYEINERVQRILSGGKLRRI